MWTRDENEGTEGRGKGVVRAGGQKRVEESRESRIAKGLSKETVKLLNYRSLLRSNRG